MSGINGRFSDWLVASDIDGTLNNKKHMLPKRNYEAIDRFINEEGGNFTLASGRGPYAIKKHYGRLPGCKNPVVVFNGAGVYDFSIGKMLWFSPICSELQDFVNKVHKKFPTCEIEIHTLDKIYILNKGIYTAGMTLLKRPETLTFRRFEDVPTDNWAKVIFYGNPFVIRDIRSYAKLNRPTVTNFMDSSPVTYEMVNIDANKWLALLKLAEILGIEKNKIAVIGDHYNDYEMLKNAPVSACCGQSPRGIKYVAKMQTCHCDRGAVADLIEFLEENK
ncbi:MAG: HAD family hydrolase [Clostridia bacterium]|nr:HAD family hydrolase [Clostridia bacterium]